MWEHLVKPLGKQFVCKWCHPPFLCTFHTAAQLSVVFAVVITAKTLYHDVTELPDVSISLDAADMNDGQSCEKKEARSRNQLDLSFKHSRLMKKETTDRKRCKKNRSRMKISSVISMKGVLGKLQSFPQGRHENSHVSGLVGCASWEQSLPLTPAKSAEFSSHSPRNLCKSSCAENKSLIRALHTTQTNSLFISDCKHKVPQL